jgi:hypothetical protein
LPSDDCNARASPGYPSYIVAPHCVAQRRFRRELQIFRLFSPRARPVNPVSFYCPSRSSTVGTTQRGGKDG